MPAVSKQKQIEMREGRPIAVVLKELYAIHGKQTEVARALGVQQGTVSSWLKELGLREWTIIVPRERAG